MSAKPKQDGLGEVLAEGAMLALAEILKKKTDINKFQDHGVICTMLRGVIKKRLNKFLSEDAPRLLASGLPEPWLKQSVSVTCLEWATEAWTQYQVWKGDQTLFDGAPRLAVDTDEVRLEARQGSLF